MRILTIWTLLSALLFAEAWAKKIKLEKLPLVGTFFPEPLYQGLPFPIRGIHGVCYNYHGKVASLTLDAGTDMCELYIAEECDGDGRTAGNKVHRKITAATEKLMMPWHSQNPMEVKSLRCWGKGEGQKLKGELKRGVGTGGVDVWAELRGKRQRMSYTA